MIDNIKERMQALERTILQDANLEAEKIKAKSHAACRRNPLAGQTKSR